MTTHRQAAVNLLDEVETAAAAPPPPGATEPPEVSPEAVLMLVLALGHGLLAIEDRLRDLQHTIDQQTGDIIRALDRLPG